MGNFGDVCGCQNVPHYIHIYLNNIDEVPLALCPLCKTEPHTTYLFNCTKINTHFMVTDLWMAPVEVGSVPLAEWALHFHSANGPGWRLDGGIPSVSLSRPGCRTHGFNSNHLIYIWF